MKMYIFVCILYSNKAERANYKTYMMISNEIFFLNTHNIMYSNEAERANYKTYYDDLKLKKRFALCRLYNNTPTLQGLTPSSRLCAHGIFE